MARPTAGELLARGAAHHRRGEVAEAAALYQDVLRLNPAEADALHLLGLLVGQSGQADAGIALIRQAVAIRPTAADYHGNLASLLQAAGHLSAAAAAARRALELHPVSPALATGVNRKPRCAPSMVIGRGLRGLMCC